MDTRLLEWFLATSEEGSLHAAARKLLVTQPALSQAMRKLERHMGCQLLERSPQGVHLTPAGESFEHYAHEILSTISRARSEAQSIATKQPRSLVVGLLGGSVSAGDLTSPIVSGFRAMHPDIQLTLRELQFRDQAAAITEGRVDVAIVRPPLERDDILLAELFSERRQVYCNQANALADASTLRMADVLEEPMVDIDPGCPQWGAFWHLDAVRGGVPEKVSSNPVFTMSEMKLSILTENCLIVGSTSAWNHSFACPDIAVIPVEDAPVSPVAVGYRRDHRNPDISRFVGFATSICSQLAAMKPGLQPAESGAMVGDQV